jgi:polyphosphate kinase 2 (PPK2 family)
MGKQGKQSDRKRKKKREKAKKHRGNVFEAGWSGPELVGFPVEESEFGNGSYPYKKKLRLREYEEAKHLLQIELLKMQNWVKDTGQRVMVLFEGRDAAGKGGAIKRFMEHLNPRGFDRSWYNRAGVDRVMGFCNSAQYLEFMRQAPQLERMLVNDGIHLFKYWFSVSREEQLRRFRSRQKDPLKQWKLSPIDLQSLDKWDEYTEAKEAMFFYTDTADAPWTVIKSDDKKRARINCMRDFLSRLDYPDKDEEVVNACDPLIVGSASNIYERDEHPLGMSTHKAS